MLALYKALIHCNSQSNKQSLSVIKVGVVYVNVCYRILLYTVYHSIHTLKITTEQWVYVQKISYILDSYYNYIITYM